MGAIEGGDYKNTNPGTGLSDFIFLGLSFSACKMRIIIASA